jgi:ribonuclease Y
VAFVGGIFFRKVFTEKLLGSAEERVSKILDKAEKDADVTKSKIILEGMEEVHKFRNTSEAEILERRREIQSHGNRMQKKEEILEKKIESIEIKEKSIVKSLQLAKERLAESEELKSCQLKKLENISKLTKNQAKEEIIQLFQEELANEKALKIKNFEEELKNDTEKIARKILCTAVQRYSAAYSTEETVSVVTLPNDDVKGRIIGREGRNIRAIENLTGVDLIIDDTPEVVSISHFDPIRREVARRALEWLIIDGRIHPAKIEEAIEKAKENIEKEIKSEGERASFETGIRGIHPELIKALGRLKFRSSYGQNILAHSLEVAHIAGLLASELGINVNLTKRCGLLHDIGKSMTFQVEGSHVDLGVDLARRYKESNEVINAIASHHGGEEPKTKAAVLIQAADAVSAARPGARRDDLESYVKRLQKLEAIVSEFEGVERCYAIQSGREVRIIVSPEVISDDKMVKVAYDICKKIESELSYPGQIKINVIRESKISNFAK